MGEPIVLRLLAAGFPVTVWNRTHEKLATVVAAGAHPVTSPADLASRVDTIFTMVSDDAAVEAIYQRY